MAVEIAFRAIRGGTSSTFFAQWFAGFTLAVGWAKLERARRRRGYKVGLELIFSGGGARS